MRAVVVRRVILLTSLFVAIVSGQEPRRTPNPPDQSKTELAPATAPTTAEAADKVKSPVGVQAMVTAAPVDPKTFVLGPEDIVAVRVWREPELSFAAQIRPDGKITMQLVGEIDAAGKTPEELKDSVVEKLSDYLNKPEVSVSVQAVMSRRYYITGEVGRTGAFPLVVPITVLEALTNAGGFKEYANKKKITILRKGKIIKFNYSEVVKGKNLDQNILVENGDYIVVP